MLGSEAFTDKYPSTKMRAVEVQISTPVHTAPSRDSIDQLNIFETKIPG